MFLLIQIKIANRPASVGRFFRLAQCLLELFLQKITSVFLRFNRLAEDGIAAAVLFLHSARGIIEVIKRFWFNRSYVRNDALSFGIDFEHRAAARASQIEAVLLGHV